MGGEAGALEEADGDLEGKEKPEEVTDPEIRWLHWRLTLCNLQFCCIVSLPVSITGGSSGQEETQKPPSVKRYGLTEE